LGVHACIWYTGVMQNKVVWFILGGIIVLAGVYFIFMYDSNVRVLPGGLKVEELSVGTGVEAVTGNTVSVHYTGRLTDGKKFDSSLDRGEPFTFQLGAGYVIKGWDEGVVGMKVGGTRRLTIPPALAYGDRDVGNGLIPPNSTLIFEVELLAVQ